MARVNDDPVGLSDAPKQAAQLVDPSVLIDMERDFSDVSVVGRFASDFCDSLEGKIDRVERSLEADDAIGASDAALSVTTSAVMVGAPRLAQAAVATQRLATDGHLSAARRSIAVLRACAADTVRETQAGYGADH